jgi:hypothetical protein
MSLPWRSDRERLPVPFHSDRDWRDSGFRSVGAVSEVCLWTSRRKLGLGRPLVLSSCRRYGVYEDIAKARPFAYERAWGWIGHYAVGILFAAILLALVPSNWLQQPTLIPALIVGLVTVGAGWFLLQPGMGAGIAASRRPNANRIRALNIAGHIVFGLGLYASALLIR